MGFMDGGGQAANAFSDNFLKTYLGIRNDSREEANAKIINQLRQQQIEQVQRAQAQEEAQAQGVGDLYQQANPGLMGMLNRPAIAEQGQAPNDVQAARFIQSMNQQQTPMGYPNQPQQSFADRIGTQGQPFVAGQPAFTDQPGIDALRRGIAPQGQTINQPSAENFANLLAQYDLKGSLPSLVALRTKDEATQARIEQFKQSDETKRFALEQRTNDASENRKQRAYDASENRKSREEQAAQNRELQRLIITDKLDTKQQQKLLTDTTVRDSSFADLDRLAAQVKILKDHPGLSGITGLKGAIPNIPGSKAANAEALLGTLKSQTAFSVLQNMRNNSKTGGALGQVSDKEGQLLQDNLGALDKAQDLKQYKESLQQIIDYTDSAKNRLQQAYNRSWKSGDKQGNQQQSPSKPKNLRQKYNY